MIPAMGIIVDGYNYIFRDRSLAAHMDRDDPASARTALVASLSPLSRRVQGELIVVFDGGASGAHLPRYQRSEGVRIIFADPVGTADARILEFVEGRPPTSRWQVVTSDRGLALLIANAGARPVTCENFREHVQNTSNISDPPPDGEHPGKSGQVEPWEVEYWSREFGLE